MKSNKVIVLANFILIVILLSNLFSSFVNVLKHSLKNIKTIMEAKNKIFNTFFAEKMLQKRLERWIEHQHFCPNTYTYTYA